MIWLAVSRVAIILGGGCLGGSFPRWQQARNQGGEALPRKIFAPPGKMCWT